MAVAPGFEVVVIVRGFEWCCCWVEVVEVWEEGEAEEAFPCWIAEWALKAARKFERKGRWVDILAWLFMCILYCVLCSWMWMWGPMRRSVSNAAMRAVDIAGGGVEGNTVAQRGEASCFHLQLAFLLS